MKFKGTVQVCDTDWIPCIFESDKPSYKEAQAYVSNRVHSGIDSGFKDKTKSYTYFFNMCDGILVKVFYSIIKGV